MNKTNDKTFLLYDTGHLFFAKTDYELILKKYITRINHIHFKDIRKKIVKKSLSENLSFRNAFLKGVFTVPGDGYINYKSIIKILYDNNYKKWLIVEAEQDPKKANPFKYAKIAYKYLSNTLSEIGYNIEL